MVLAQGLLLCAYTVTTIAVLKRAGWITYVSLSLCLSLSLSFSGHDEACSFMNRLYVNLSITIYEAAVGLIDLWCHMLFKLYKMKLKF
jgi:hypothetical protein